MKCFELNTQGDVVIRDNDIQMANGAELLAQKIKQVLGTNRGEWWKNPREGIPMQKVLKKNPNDAVIKDYIRTALRQVDPMLSMAACQITTEGRHMKIYLEVTGTGDITNMELEV